ncbi:hypothetical protein G443_001785 [Actinoalloteichus cyanogriseus DSM 43889]|uniref:DNA-binding protein n=2 Tax=Pseudonocardiaceae TaxID=2070 RepID=A0ABT1JG96_ACTCY|nr:hypothetical protein [Actinoalloteichus caeruleus DSM 43889]
MRDTLNSMTPGLEAALARAGLRVNASEFLAYVEDAARRLTPPHPDPGAFLSPDQQRVLTEVGLDLSPQDPGEPDYRAGTVAAEAVLLDSALTLTEAADRLRVGIADVEARIAAGRVAGWRGRGGWRLPAWQFTEIGVLPGLAEVLDAVPDDQPDLVVAGFMMTAQATLLVDGHPVTPRRWLLTGGAPEAVAELAALLGRPV